MAELTGWSVPLGDLALPFEGLPTVWLVLFSVAFTVVVAMLVWTTALFVLGQRYRLPPIKSDADYHWVFLVPALNEEVTIADSVARLLAIEAAQRTIVVIDDGSEDRTPEILAANAHPDLRVLRRNPPHAQQGKAAALNNAYRELGNLVGDVPRERVVAVVVDADGRLDPAATMYVAPHFDTADVGGVQALVRIYNRSRLLTLMQDIEFSIYCYLYQAGRSDWGTAGMGGNGQFNRLAALDAVAEGEGPWRDRLTEDQDLGLRLIGAGWKGRQEPRAIVSQQGLPGLRKLYRQRTRWSQGNLQAIGLVGEVWRAPLPLIPRVEQVAYLLLPFVQGLVGLTLLAALGLALFGDVSFWDGGPLWQLGFFYLLGFGGIILGCLARGRPRGAGGMFAGYLLAHPYAFYSWLLWPVLVRAGLRQLTERRDWAKTDREPVAAEDEG